MAKAAAKTPAPKKATAKSAPAKTKAETAADLAHGTEEEEVTEEEVTEETEEQEAAEREAPAMEAAAEPTDFDQLLDLSRAIDPKFGSEMAKEGTQHFLVRMLTALTDSTAEQFDSLPLTAQTWYENAVEEGNNKQDITPPDGYIAPSAAAPAAKKAAGKKKAATAKTPKEPKAPKAPKVPKVREASKTYPIRLLVCKNPSITLEALVAALPSAGKTTISTVRSDALATLKAAAESGWSAPA